MIRYVLSVILICSMMAVSMTAVGQVEELNTEKQVEQEISEIEAAANSLLYNEEVTNSGSAPTREITVSFPQNSLTTSKINGVLFENIMDAGSPSPVTYVDYTVDNRPAGQQIMDAPVVSADGDPIELEGEQNLQLQLRLEQDENEEQVVVVERISETLLGETNFEITDITTNSPILTDETGTIAATVENTGEKRDTQTVDFDIPGIGASPRQVTLDGGESSTETFSFSAQGREQGDYALEVASEDDSSSKQITIGQSPIGADRWDASGPGNYDVSDTGSSTVAFNYGYGGVPSDTQEWTYEATAQADRDITVDWTFAGHHSWYKSEGDAYLSVDGDEVHLSSPAGNGRFSDSGSKTISVNEGETIQVRITGNHHDRAERLSGEFTLTF